MVVAPGGGLTRFGVGGCWSQGRGRRVARGRGAALSSTTLLALTAGGRGSKRGGGGGELGHGLTDPCRAWFRLTRCHCLLVPASVLHCFSLFFLSCGGGGGAVAFVTWHCRAPPPPSRRQQRSLGIWVVASPPPVAAGAAMRRGRRLCCVVPRPSCGRGNAPGEGGLRPRRRGLPKWVRRLQGARSGCHRRRSPAPRRPCAWKASARTVRPASGSSSPLHPPLVPTSRPLRPSSPPTSAMGSRARAWRSPRASRETLLERETGNGWWPK